MLEGKQAKDFCLQNQKGKQICLKEIKEKIVLYFYPKDNTPGCTLEAKQFTDLASEFAEEKTTLIGISKDTVESHQKFCDKHNLSITLLSDPDFRVHKMFEAYGKKKFMGKEYLGTMRSTVLIDENKKIIKHWPKVSPIGHAKEVLKFLKEN